ncbi:MAG: hypothetical protein ACOY9C_13810 [Pseudomonadota bacterium]
MALASGKDPAQGDRLAGVDPAPAAAAGFWVAPGDATRTLGDIVACGGALAAGCARCGHTRQWLAAELATAPAGLTVGAITARLVCGQDGCRSRTGTLAVLRPPDRRPAARRRHLSDRDVARIRAMAEQVTEDHQPAILEDLDAPIRVGACLPGQETYSGAHVMTAWRGRLVLAWPLSRKARNRRRAVDDLYA